MKIDFRTKKESNSIQEKDFLALLPADRFYRFLEMAERLKNFPVKESKVSKTENSFVIEIKTS
ncbi:hypothetical protein [Flagellimonas nanhaiensis]|uniref:Uncharacterized protein n=1 Tax=Flagellimonas nanhaiensis TaxID=2292706 RepID=A0A371JLJ2_9FLAO|nr:hypothetical protein [Allomuricauda nanhaiensis]RDY57882.1 hypothetical protein DX873_17175 [Allomuricauda nanhaiensis]